MDIRDQIKIDMAPCRIASKIATGLTAIYKEIKAQESDDKKRYFYSGVDPGIKITLHLNTIDCVTFFYNEFLDFVLYYYDALYIKLVKAIDSNERLVIQTTVDIIILLEDDEAFVHYRIVSGAFITEVHPARFLSITTLKAAIAAQSNKSRLHNGIIANLVEMRRVQQNTRIFADELLSVPLFGMHYLAAKERFTKVHREEDVHAHDCGKLEIVDAEEPQGVAIVLSQKRKSAEL